MHYIQQLTKYIWILTFLFVVKSYPQNGQNYELFKVLSKPHFYNVVNKNEKIFLGTNQGLFEYDTKNDEVFLVDKNIIGYVDNNLNPAAFGGTEFVTKYNFSLPERFKSKYNRAVENENKVALVSEGRLFILKKTFFEFTYFPSVRSISENFVGTYDGVFYKDKKIDNPKYVSGKIKEFENVSFICWDGLIAINPDQNQYSIENYSLDGNYINNLKVGDIYDVDEINHPEYLLFCTEGVFKYNLNSSEIEAIDPSEENFPLFNNSALKTIKLYYDKKSLKAFYPLLTKIDTLLVFEEDVKFLTTDSLNNFKNLFAINVNDKLINYKIKSDSLQHFSRHVVKNLREKSHTLNFFSNHLFVSGDKGIEIFNLFNNERIDISFLNEINRFANFVLDDVLYLGGVSGLYTIESNQFKEFLISNRTFNHIIDENNENKMNLFMIIISSTLFFLSIILIMYLKIKPKKKNLIKLKDIDHYIIKNLSTVSILSISEHFNLGVHDLYKIMGKNKPGVYIRKIRLKQIKAMRGENFSEEEISKATGFSVSYLKKL